MKFALITIVLLAAVLAVQADVYMHNPRGSNNRCDEQNNNRNNNNKLMNTQNNGAGGYALAPPMSFHAGSILSLEWTNQHGCGGGGKANCEIIWQYACSDTFKDGEADDPTGDGNGNTCTDEITAGNENDADVGRHEPLTYFEDCNARERNTNLFNADQNVNNNNGAQATRQNAGGGSSGFECQEERDYYPYWHPTPFVDIAVLTTNTSRCDYYQAESENVKPRNFCSEPEFNNKKECVAGGGSWNENPAHNSDNYWNTVAPDCQPAPWGRANSLSNTHTGYLASYNWTIPKQGIDGPQPACFVRIRYNVSTNDYDSWNIDASQNGNQSPVENDPYVDADEGTYLRLAIATNQFGRTFEDRSYTFELLTKRITLPFRQIWNLNVRGKRGNIAQVRNCVEYDFVPQRMTLRRGDFVHIQWTGSNHNPDGNAGEGSAGKDRHNMIQMVNNDLGANYFEPQEDQELFKYEEQAFRAAFIDQDQSTCKNLEQLENDNDDQATNNCAKLNQNPTGYFDLGVTRLNRTGTFNYMSTRNNNFTNRGQKASMVIQSWFGPWILLVLLLIVGFLGIVVIGGLGVVFLGFGGTGAAMAYFQGKSGKVYSRTASRGSFSNSSHGSRKSGGSSRSKSSGRSKNSFGGSMI